MDHLLGGRVRHHLPFWKTFTQDKFVLDCVRGIRLEFSTSPPIQHRLPFQIRMSESEMQFVDKKIAQLLKNDSISMCDTPPSVSGTWVSNIFLVPKKTQNEYRMILNLKHLNKFIQYRKFKMTQIYKVLDMIQPSSWATSIDLIDAYSSLFVHPDHWSYLCFQWRGKFYYFKCLPQGLTSAPRIFS